MKYLLHPAWLDRAIRVELVGCGGTGSAVARMLAKLHLSLLALGHPHGLAVRLWDGDAVARSNIGRQDFTFEDEGSNKAQVLAARYNIAYGLEWQAEPTFATPKDIDGSHWSGPDLDLLITCVDKASVRIAIGEFFTLKRNKTDPQGPTDVLWLDFGNGANTGQVVLGHLLTWEPKEGVTRLPNVWNLFPTLKEIDDDAEPTCSLADALRSQQFGINDCIATAGISSVLVPLLTLGEISHHGVFVDMLAASTVPLPIDPEGWAFLMAAGGKKTASKQSAKTRAKRSRRTAIRSRGAGLAGDSK